MQRRWLKRPELILRILMRDLKYFEPEEFERCTPPCHMEECNDSALLMLDTLRDLCGFPIYLNSAYRTVSYEKKKGRTGTSSHCKGVAFDIRCVDTRDRYVLVRNALKVGFTRIGIGKTYIHVDCDYSKHDSIWLY